jgi:arylsulfatase A-like enzyme
VKANRDRPFFIYLPHSMPHIPLYVPDDVRDPDPKNAYTNTIEHIDSEVGRLLRTLDETQLTDSTYVIFTSDNGPWLPFKHHGGSAGPLREGKGTTFEGGQRVPCIIRGPGIPAGTVCDELTGTIDVLPSLAAITRTPLPATRKIDGVDASALWMGTAKQSPRTEFLYYTAQGNLEGIRQRNWKLLVKKPEPPRQPQSKAQPKATIESPQKAQAPTVLLFDLKHDRGEQNNLAPNHPEVVHRLRARMEELDAEVTLNARAPWVKP